MDSKASCNASNCLQIVISCILNAWHCPISENDNDFQGFFWACRFWHRIDSKESCTQSNCLWIVIFHILCEQTWHILTTDNNFWGWMIPAKGIPCIFIAALPVNAKTEFIIIHVVQHQIACRLSYYASYIHGNGISRILRTTLGGIWYC
jgi:hypothetical protein